MDNDVATRGLDLADLVRPGVVAVLPAVGDAAVDGHFELSLLKLDGLQNSKSAVGKEVALEGRNMRNTQVEPAFRSPRMSKERALRWLQLLETLHAHRHKGRENRKHVKLSR